MDLPLYGKVKLSETSKTELLDLWKQLIRKYDIPIKENCKVEGIFEENGYYRVETLKGEKFTSKHILLSIGAAARQENWVSPVNHWRKWHTGC